MPIAQDNLEPLSLFNKTNSVYLLDKTAETKD